MQFTHPIYLLLLVPILTGLFFSFKHVHGMARGRKLFAFVIRGLLATCIVLALAGIESRRPNEGICTIFLVDYSDSISDADRRQAQEFVNKATQSLGVHDQAGVVVFGKEAVLETAPGGKRSFDRILSKVDGSASDLAAAVRLASASFPDGKARRIVVLSDGDETNGDLAGAAQVAATDGIALDHVVLGLKDRAGEASVIALDAPDEVRADQPFDIRLQIDSTVDQSGTLDIDRDGILLKKMPIHLDAGMNTIVVPEKQKDTGFHRYRATLHAAKDLDNRNNVGMGFVSVRGKPKVLILQEKLANNELANTLQQNGVGVELRGPASIPTKPEELQAFDAIILNDINASNMTPTQMKLMQAAVRDSGVGLAMIGGENSFLPGGYYGTPIAETLPVDLNIRQRKSFPSTSVAIIIDASGSMGMIEDGVPKLRLAAQAAEATVKMMSTMDRVGVAGSSSGIEFVAPMQKLTDKDSVINQIRKMSLGGGGIYIQPSMLAAETVLMAEPSKVRHFILLSDGNDAEDHGDSEAIAARMRLNHITTSVVAIGDGKDIEFLKQVATVGGGRFYLAKHGNQLPAIFTQDSALISRSAIEEGAFIPKMLRGDEILRGIDGTPPLYAYCLVDSRPLARVSMRTKKDDPLLVTWQYGLGSSLAFTSDAQSRWARDWVGWPGFSAFWSQAARAISRRATLNNYQVAVHQQGSKGIIELKAFDRLGNPMSNTDAKVRISTPAGDSKEVSVTQEAPGLYKGSFESTDIGSYIVTVSEPDPATGGQRVSSSGFSVSYPPEYRTYRPNRPLLQQASAITGGKLLTDPKDSLRPVKNPGTSITELWPTIMMLAAFLLPFDIAIRRIALPVKEILMKALAAMRRKPQEPIAQQVTVGRLHQAKQRAQREGTPEVQLPQPAPETERIPVGATASRPSAPTATSKSLLEMKRKRQSQPEDES